MTRVGFIGAGHIGSNVARGLVARGHEVILSNSRGPETLAELVAELGPLASAATPYEAAEAGDLYVVAIPFKALEAVPVAPLAGKIVLDANNYYWERDGRIAALDEKRATTSGLLQEHLPESRVAKAFNHIRWDQILTHGTPAGTPDRRALATSSDFADASQFVVDLYDAFGFDAVEIGPLSDSWRVERDQPAYASRQNREQLVANLARAQR